MTVTKKLEEQTLTFTLTGRLDTTTAPIFEGELAGVPAEVNSLILDFAGVEYVSSAGLRLLLTAQKKMNALGGKLTLTGVCEAVNEIFEITGFCDILTIV